MSNVFRRLFQPARKQSIFRTEVTGASGVGRVFGGLVACLIVVGLLSSDRLVMMAERQEFGTDRDRWLAAAETVDAVASATQLDRPAAALDAALGRGQSEPADVVLGELAAGSATSSTGDLAPSETVPRETVPPDTPPPEAVPPDATATTADTSTTAPPTSTTTSTTVPTTSLTLPLLGVASVNAPLRVWAGGDSLGEYVGSELLYRVVDTNLSLVELDYGISTGLTRPDYFDWPARFSEVMQRDERPNVVVFMAGGNDDQDMQVDGERVVVGTPEWQVAYRERVATMMDVAAYPDVQMLWINLPPMRDARRHTISQEINAALDAEAGSRSWVQVIDIIDLFSNENGGFEQFIDEPDGSATRNARASDGVHITRSASNWIAELVWASVAEQWEFDTEAVATTAPPGSAPSTTTPESTATTQQPDG